MKPITHRVYDVLLNQSDRLTCQQITDMIGGDVSKKAVYGAIDLVTNWYGVDMLVKKVDGINTYKMVAKENRIDHHTAINMIFSGRSAEIFG